MPRAILRNGVIYPIEPLPPKWQDGRELRVEASVGVDEDQDLESWYQQLDEDASKNDPADWAKVEQAIRVADDLI